MYRDEGTEDKRKREEVEEHIEKVKARRASGKDDKAPEMIKLLQRKGKECIWIICKEAWKTINTEGTGKQFIDTNTKVWSSECM